MKYQPIDCNFYDILEANAVLRKQVAIVFLNEVEEKQTIQAIIKDLYIKNKAEYMKLTNGQEIRLDKLIMVDGNELNGSCGI
jgi:Rho-binding antiterminator